MWKLESETEAAAPGWRRRCPGGCLLHVEGRRVSQVALTQSGEGLRKSLATGQCGSATCCAPRPDGVSGGSLRLSGKRLSLKSLILSLRSGRAGPFRTAGGRAAISYIPSEPFRKSKWLRRQVVFFAALFAM